MLNTRLKNGLNTLFMKVFRIFNSREVTIAESTPAQEKEYYRYEQIGSSGMSLLTENFLRGNLLRESCEKSPRNVLKAIDELHRVSGDPVYLLFAADVCRYWAERAGPEEKVQFCLTALRYCCFAFSSELKRQTESGERQDGQLQLQELQICNESTAGIFLYLKERNLLDAGPFSLTGTDGWEFVFEKPSFQFSVPRDAVSDLFLCSSRRIRTLRLINRHPGIGVPLVARVSETNLNRTLRIPPGLTVPVTLFFRVRILSDKKLALYPCYQDTSVSETGKAAEWGIDPTRHWTLARDFTTPLACFMNDIRQRNLLAGMLNPVKYDEYTGLYMVEPYRPEKIPVIFVHGLMSSPETWGQMINSLKYDPTIRRKYQFWFWSYSTGIPVPVSARRLRQTLLDAREELCTTPEAVRNFEKMVLVGHSMGGLVARLLLQQEPHRIVETLAGCSWEEAMAKLIPEDRELIRKTAILDPLPFVKRVVFMAVPHRGSAVAQKKIANLGIRLIRLPEEILKNKDAYRRIWKALWPSERIVWRKESFLTGIDNLNPKSFFVRWAGDAPVKTGVVCHSIIGNRKKAGCPGGSDGIVPYSSSHLDNAASECIVQSDHGVHRNPEAIRELLRILLLHLKENAE